MNPAAPPDRGESAVRWADAHNHLHHCEDAAAHTHPCVINATCEGDWPAVLATAASAPHRLAALGIHPWYAHTASDGWAERLDGMLKYDAARSIGECGLDAKTRDCPLDVQIPVFREHLRLAAQTARPVSIHCVGAWGELFNALDTPDRPTRFLMHAFNGSVESARRLADLGAYFSISARAMALSGTKILRAFQTIPPERILLETDAPNTADDLATTGPAIADKLGYTTQAFASFTVVNFHRLFTSSPT